MEPSIVGQQPVQKCVLTIFVMCYNRIDMAMEAVNSIIPQLTEQVRLIVSDNSTQEGLLARLEGHDQKAMEFRRRKPSLPALDHFNLCMSEVDSPYFMLFHDDDLLLPDAVAAVMAAIDQYCDAVALGLNAVIEKNGVRTGSSFLSDSEVERINSPQQLLGCYFSKGNAGIAPFPGYIYSARVARELQFTASAGKYSDVAFLMSVSSLGEIVWLSRPHMVYRLHASNDSNVESRRDRLRFLAFLKRHPHWVDVNTLVDYRYFIYKRLAKPSSASAARIRRYLKIRRAFRLPNLSHTAMKFKFRVVGKKKSI